MTRSGQKVAIVGFSQGGMIGRWALKYWPDTRAKVGELVGIDPSNHGTLDAYPVCAAAGLRARRSGSSRRSRTFTTALNSGPETFAGIDYTSMFTPTDEVVVPNLPPAPSSALTTGAGRRANISTFDVCPGHLADHLSMGSFDALAYALVIDALDHGGLASAGAHRPVGVPGAAPARRRPGDVPDPPRRVHGGRRPAGRHLPARARRAAAQGVRARLRSGVSDGAR